MSNLVKRLREGTDWYKSDCEIRMEAANRIEELEKALRACHGALQIAFECYVHGGVFGIHHNDAVDADILGRKALEINHA